jgi:hypothetical protein
MKQMALESIELPVLVEKPAERFLSFVYIHAPSVWCVRPSRIFAVSEILMLCKCNVGNSDAAICIHSQLRIRDAARAGTPPGKGISIIEINGPRLSGTRISLIARSEPW